MEPRPEGPIAPQPRDLTLPLDRDLFLRSLLRELAGTLEAVVGLDEARGFVSVVGRRIGEQIGAGYRKALDRERFDARLVADVLVDLKRRIEGDFYVLEVTDDRIVLGNRACPFGDKVVGRPSLCMMTSNVFGTIAADHLGYGTVELRATLAEGSPECRVAVYFRPGSEADRVDGREYYGPAEPDE
ncbi:MAG: methanogen output domain 1-containing protein [Longimicrobiales bacterium]